MRQLICGTKVLSKTCFDRPLAFSVHGRQMGTLTLDIISVHAPSDAMRHILIYSVLDN